MLSTTDVPPGAYQGDVDSSKDKKWLKDFSVDSSSVGSSQAAGASGSSTDGEFSRVLAAHDALVDVTEEESVVFLSEAFTKAFGSRAPLLPLHARTLAGLSTWATRSDSAKTLRDILRELYLQAHRIGAIAHLFDFPGQPGNGYWTVCKSFVR
jgi:hypothetical protein